MKNNRADRHHDQVDQAISLNDAGLAAHTAAREGELRAALAAVIAATELSSRRGA